MKRIVLGIQYDGTPWRGWQKQLSGGTVQDALEAALTRFANQSISTHCAGRTDAGVHAIEQVVHFDVDVDRETISWVRGVNASLPSSIAVRWARVLSLPENDSFHSRYSATSRTYHYVVYNHPVRSPLLASRAGWCFRPLDEARMNEAAQALIGKHDFTSFRAAECQSFSPERLMHEISVRRRDDLVVFTLRANAFLHHMVRNLVGSLLQVGIGKQPVGWMAELLAARNRHLAAPTFAPDGLYLARVNYDDRWALPQQDDHSLFPSAQFPF